MENKQDFVIVNGVLKEYNGPGGDVTIPEGVTEIGKDVFEVCRPVLIAPHIPISGVAKVGYLKYIKRQRKQRFSVAVWHEDLLRVMLAEKMLDRKDIDPLLAECGQQNNIAAKAAVLDYADRNLKPWTRRRN